MTAHSNQATNLDNDDLDNDVVTILPIELPELDNEAADKHGSYAKHIAAVELVSHVKVRLDVMLGTATTNVGELMDLANGTVMTLDRHIGDSVDVQLNGKVICRAQIVAVGEQFGIRVTDVQEALHAGS